MAFMIKILTPQHHVFSVVKKCLVLCVGWLLAFGIYATPAQATGVYSMQPLSAGEDTWVIDDAEVLSRLTKGALSKKLSELAQATGYEVRFVTIHRLDYGETIQSFTDALFESWYPTPEAQENQVLVALDNVTNTSAIHVGDGAKAILSDEIAESVAQETLQVPLRVSNKYNQALSDVSDRLIAVLSGEADPGPPIVVDTTQTESTFATAEETKGSNATVWVIGFLIAATIIPMVTYYLYIR
jgi:uncharacterized protein